MMPFYERENIIIYCGDCLEIMPRLEGPFDAIIADLPYGTTACDWDDVIPFESLWKEYKRLIKGNRAIILTACVPFNYAVHSSNPGWYKYEWIWNKISASSPTNSLVMPKRIHEYIMIFGEGQILYNPQMWDAGYKNGKRGAAKRQFAPGRKAKYDKEFTHKENETLRYPKSIIDLSFQANECNTTVRLHPTQKPVELLRYLIRTYTNPGDLILDNTMGSGTTLVAAQIEGRRAVGIDISEEYCQTAVDRLKPPGFLALLQDGKKEAQQIGLLSHE